MNNIDLLQYIDPNLIIGIVVIYVLGVVLKKSELFKDKYIPLILSIAAFVICFSFFLGAEPRITLNVVLKAIYSSLIQGFLITASAVYGNQIGKQLGKKE